MVTLTSTKNRNFKCAPSQYCGFSNVLSSWTAKFTRKALKYCEERFESRDLHNELCVLDGNQLLQLNQSSNFEQSSLNAQQISYLNPPPFRTSHESLDFRIDHLKATPPPKQLKLVMENDTAQTLLYTWRLPSRLSN